jgi:DNA-binding LacI/PurR family transcriptional regulator
MAPQRRPRGRRVTIYDVAASAGVSATTVSHALNAKGRVDPATRARVVATAAELGYRASRAARALRVRRTGAIAFLVPAFEEENTQLEMLSLDLYMIQASAAAGSAFARGHSLLLIPPVASADELDSLGIDGGIVCDPVRGDRLVGLFEELDIPVVTIERDLGRPASRWYVKADNDADVTRMLEHLAAAGAARIAFMRFDADIAWAREGEDAYRAWCARHDCEPLLVPTSPHGLENSAYRVACELLDRTEPPDAILAPASRFPAGVLRAAGERGLEVPRDLMVATAIDTHEAREAAPPITAIDTKPAQQGAAAAEMLIARVEGMPVETPRITPSALLERASTRGR